MSEETEYCQSCAGSGEGPADGTRCSECKGSGEVPVTPTPEPDTDAELTVDEQMTLQLRARCNDFAAALAGKVMAQLKRGEPVMIQDKHGAAMVWQHVMMIRHHVPRILVFLGLPEMDETEEMMTLALHEQFSACGIVDPQRIEVLTIQDREQAQHVMDGTIIPFTLEDAGN